MSHLLSDDALQYQISMELQGIRGRLQDGMGSYFVGLTKPLTPQENFERSDSPIRFYAAREARMGGAAKRSFSAARL